MTSLYRPRSAVTPFKTVVVAHGASAGTSVVPLVTLAKLATGCPSSLGGAVATAPMPLHRVPKKKVITSQVASVTAN